MARLRSKIIAASDQMTGMFCRRCMFLSCRRLLGIHIPLYSSKIRATGSCHGIHYAYISQRDACFKLIAMSLPETNHCNYQGCCHGYSSCLSLHAHLTHGVTYRGGRGGGWGVEETLRFNVLKESSALMAGI